MTTIPDYLPALASGSHGPGSGRMCIMNAISYLKGEKQITDFPTCVDPLLARVAQHVNDGICGRDHKRLSSDDAELCSACSHKVWLFGMPLMGTAEVWQGVDPARQMNLYWRMLATEMSTGMWGSQTEVVRLVARAITSTRPIRANAIVGGGRRRFVDSYAEILSIIEMAWLAAPDALEIEGRFSGFVSWLRHVVTTHENTMVLSNVMTVGKTVAELLAGFQGRRTARYALAFGDRDTALPWGNRMFQLWNRVRPPYPAPTTPELPTRAELERIVSAANATAAV